MIGLTDLEAGIWIFFFVRGSGAHIPGLGCERPSVGCHIPFWLSRPTDLQACSWGSLGADSKGPRASWGPWAPQNTEGPSEKLRLPYHCALTVLVEVPWIPPYGPRIWSSDISNTNVISP